jgi:hypothetical protein
MDLINELVHNYGAGIYVKDDVGQNILHYVALSDSASCAKQLLKIINLKRLKGIGDDEGFTPVHMAASEGKLNTLQGLNI